MKIFLVVALLLAVPYTPVKKYDPVRNADQDIKDAVVEAQRTGKRILLEVGGDWCKWCHIMDDYFDKNPKLTASRDSSFITVKINFSPQNENEKVLSKYPRIPGIRTCLCSIPTARCCIPNLPAILKKERATTCRSSRTS